MSVASTSLTANPLQYARSLLGSGNGTPSSATSLGGLDALFSSFTSLVTGGQSSPSAGVASGLSLAPLSAGTLSALLSLQGGGTSGSGQPSCGNAQSAGLDPTGSASQRHSHLHKQLTATQAQVSTIGAPTTKTTA